MNTPVRIGIGGPGGSGKTALVDALCKAMRDRYQLGVITNDIFTREDMEFLVKSEALTPDRIIGVQTGGCPHSAIREQRSMSSAVFPETTPCRSGQNTIFLESGGDIQASSFTTGPVDPSTYLISGSGLVWRLRI